jgi:tetratricopeptide (TPR) repeat protein
MQRHVIFLLLIICIGVIFAAGCTNTGSTNVIPQVTTVISSPTPQIVCTTVLQTSTPTLTPTSNIASASASNSADTSASFNSAGALYTESVDLANAGDYQDALNAADAALADNVSSLIPIIQSNRAGILVELGRYDEAIAAANVAINTPGNLPTLRSIAYYNEANALQALGRSAEADAAYANASALNPTLKHP